jgi:hypothetical protein
MFKWFSICVILSALLVAAVTFLWISRIRYNLANINEVVSLSRSDHFAESFPGTRWLNNVVSSSRNDYSNVLFPMPDDMRLVSREQNRYCKLDQDRIYICDYNGLVIHKLCAPSATSWNLRESVIGASKDWIFVEIGIIKASEHREDTSLYFSRINSTGENWNRIDCNNSDMFAKYVVDSRTQYFYVIHEKNSFIFDPNSNQIIKRFTVPLSAMNVDINSEKGILISGWDNREPGFVRRMLILDPSTLKIKELSQQGQLARWGADGQILFAMGDGNNELWTAKPDGSSAQRICSFSPACKGFYGRIQVGLDPNCIIYQPNKSRLAILDLGLKQIKIIKIFDKF